MLSAHAESASPPHDVKASLLRRLSRVGLARSPEPKPPELPEPPSTFAAPTPASASSASPRAAQPTLPPVPAAPANSHSSTSFQQPVFDPPQHTHELPSHPHDGSSHLRAHASLEPPKDIWIDCDPGHDDALALLMATHHPGLRLVGVSTVSGNAPGRATYLNAARVLVAVGADRILRARASSPLQAGHWAAPTPPSADPDVMYPVLIRGADSPLLRTARHDASIHGQDGLGGVLGLPSYDDPAMIKRIWASYAGFDPEFVEDTNASEAVAPQLDIPAPSPDRVVAALATELKRRRRVGAPALHICITGPCTNIALLIKLHPALVAPDTIASITIMGGAAGSPGNRWALGEFNAACDPEALAIVMYHPVKVVMAGLNVTHQAIFTPQVHDRLLQRVSTGPASTTGPGGSGTNRPPPPPSNVRKLVSSAVTFFASTYCNDFGFKYGPPVHDLLTVVYVADPKLFYTYDLPTTHMGPHAAGIHASQAKALALAVPVVHSQGPISYADPRRTFAPLRYRVEVETGNGLASGATVVDFYNTWGRPNDTWGKEGKNVEVLEELDTEGLWNLLLDVIDCADHALLA